MSAAQDAADYLASQMQNICAQLAHDVCAAIPREYYVSWYGADKFDACVSNLSQFLLQTRGADANAIAAVGADTWLQNFLARPVFGWDDTVGTVTFALTVSDGSPIVFPIPAQPFGSGTYRLSPLIAPMLFAYGIDDAIDTASGIIAKGYVIDNLRLGISERVYRLYWGYAMQGTLGYTDMTGDVRIRLDSITLPRITYNKIGFALGDNGGAVVSVLTDSGVMYGYSPSDTVQSLQNSIINAARPVQATVNFFGIIAPNRARAFVPQTDTESPIQMGSPVADIPDNQPGLLDALNWPKKIIQPYIDIGNQARDARRKADVVAAIKGIMYVFSVVSLGALIQNALTSGGFFSMTGQKIAGSLVSLASQLKGMMSPAPVSTPPSSVPVVSVNTPAPTPTPTQDVVTAPVQTTQPSTPAPDTFTTQPGNEVLPVLQTAASAVSIVRLAGLALGLLALFK